MGSAYFQLLLLAAVAVFLILRLRNVLGTRDGFEPTIDRNRVVNPQDVAGEAPQDEEFKDEDISDFAEADSPLATSLGEMKVVEPGFSVATFMEGAKNAYELILMAFENDDLDTLEQYLSDDVYESFRQVIVNRQEQGLKVEASFIGIRETELVHALFDRRSEEAEITVRFVAEMTSVVKNTDGEIVEGDPHAIKKQKDVWTFHRVMGDDDPTWILIETGV